MYKKTNVFIINCPCVCYFSFSIFFSTVSPNTSDIMKNYFQIFQAHSSVEKAGLIALVKMRFIECDDELSMRGDAIQEVIDKDREDGLIPFYVCFCHFVYFFFGYIF